MVSLSSFCSSEGQSYSRLTILGGDEFGMELCGSFRHLLKIYQNMPDIINQRWARDHGFVFLHEYINSSGKKDMWQKKPPRSNTRLNSAVEKNPNPSVERSDKDGKEFEIVLPSFFF